jgi:hypothetical protein
MSTIDLGIAETVVRQGADVPPQKKVQAAVVAESCDFYVGSVKIESQPARSVVSRTATGVNPNPQRQERRARARPNQPAY